MVEKHLRNQKKVELLAVKKILKNFSHLGKNLGVDDDKFDLAIKNIQDIGYASEQPRKIYV